MSVSDPQDPKQTYNASAVMAASISGSTGPRESIKLSERAEQVASQFAQNAISPFVLAAALRIVEFLAVTIIGLSVYFAYVVPIDGIKLSYFMTCFLAGVLTLVGFQATDSYQVSSLRTNVRNWVAFSEPGLRCLHFWPCSRFSPVNQKHFQEFGLVPGTLSVSAFLLFFAVLFPFLSGAGHKTAVLKDEQLWWVAVKMLKT